MRQKRSYFFIPGKKRFAKSSEPNEKAFRDLMESTAFHTEDDSTATYSEQGLAKLATDTEAKDRTNPASGMAKVIRAHHLPELITTITGDDTDDSDRAEGDPGYAPTELTGRGIKITYLKRTLSTFFRRVFRVENTLVFQDSGHGTMQITEAVPGTIKFKALVTTGPAGPAGASGAAAPPNTVGTNPFVVRCQPDGTPLDLPITAKIALYYNGAQIDMSGFNFADPLVLIKAETNCNASVSHSGPNCLVTLNVVTANIGDVTIDIYYNSTWTTITIPYAKVRNGEDACNWTYKGELASAPANPIYYWWYHLQGTRFAYFYDTDNNWKLLPFSGPNPTHYETLTNAGLNISLENGTAENIIVHVPNGIVLVGPINLNPAGAFEDGKKFNIIFDNGFDSNGQSVMLMNETVSDTDCSIGFFQMVSIYTSGDNSWKSFYNIDTLKKGSQDVFDVVKVPAANVLSIGSSPYALSPIANATKFFNLYRCVAIATNGANPYTVVGINKLVVYGEVSSADIDMTVLTDANGAINIADIVSFANVLSLGAYAGDQLFLSTDTNVDPAGGGDHDLYLVLGYYIESIP